jgi:probable selenate reductase FAD-binding subunit
MMTVREYHRPQTLEEALALLSRVEVDTVPLGGGAVLQKDAAAPLAVVDLQALGLNAITFEGKVIDIGATATLQALLDTPGLPAGLYAAVRHQASYNLRQMATVAGSLVACDGRSPFAVAMLALDAELTVAQHATRNTPLSLGNFLPLRVLRARLITSITIPANARLAYEYVARTPADLPIVCAAVAQWPSGRTRLALGGWGAAPLLALDGPEAGGLEAAAQNAYAAAGDEWASAEYRREIAGVLARRCLSVF